MRLLFAWLSPSRLLAPLTLVLLSPSPVSADTPAPSNGSGANAADSAHRQILVEDAYPPATVCRTCHEDHYREWSVSPHAYAQVSPIFNAMHAEIVKRTSGTFGDFCIRCHTPIGMQLGEPIFMPNAERAPVSFEGVTCIVCHRVNKDYGKFSGRRKVQSGSIFQPIFGPTGNEEVERVIADRNKFGVVTESGTPGRKIHSEARLFEPIESPAFCASCHDVTFVNGFRLEEAFSEYKSSPAAARGETCQDCHMGIEPGKAMGYREAPAARVGKHETRVRKRTNHMWPGPDHSVVHPGIYPHNPHAAEFASMNEWLQFDYQAGWGTDAFEMKVADDALFPPRWALVDDRYDAREILDDQQALLDEAYEQGTRLLRNGYQLGKIAVDHADANGLQFAVEIQNASDGHNVPTGFIGERVVFLQVTVTDAEGQVVFRSGDLDPNGDVRDLHSLYVHNHELPLDTQLFSLQSRFLTFNQRGGEREQVLSVNYSVDPLPYARPDTRPSILAGRTLSARIHRMGIEPKGSRWARYEVSGDALTGTPPYSANIKLIAGMVPPNLVDDIKSVGFDYGMSAREVADAVVAGHRILWERDVELRVD